MNDPDRFLAYAIGAVLLSFAAVLLAVAYTTVRYWSLQ